MFQPVCCRQRSMFEAWSVVQMTLTHSIHISLLLNVLASGRLGKWPTNSDPFREGPCQSSWKNTSATAVLHSIAMGVDLGISLEYLTGPILIPRFLVFLKCWCSSKRASQISDDSRTLPSSSFPIKGRTTLSRWTCLSFLSTSQASYADIPLVLKPSHLASKLV